MSFASTGANAIAASDVNAVILAAGAVQRSSETSVLSGLIAGGTTFTAKYRVYRRRRGELHLLEPVDHGDPAPVDG
jgi:hypothetical protein